jgi:PAS domain-containing protein
VQPLGASPECADQVPERDRPPLLTQPPCRLEERRPDDLQIARRGPRRQAVGDPDAVHPHRRGSGAQGFGEGSAGGLARGGRGGIIGPAPRHREEREHRQEPVHAAIVNLCGSCAFQVCGTFAGRLAGAIHCIDGPPGRGGGTRWFHRSIVSAIPQTAGVPVAPPQRVARTRFCSRCAVTAEEPEGQLVPYGFGRVCERCGMGVMLSAPQKAVPASGGAFVVVTREGRVSAVSEPAEHLVGGEADLLGAPIASALTSEDGDEHLVRVLARAAGGGREVVELPVTPTGEGSARLGPMKARVASCGPPRAALLVLERTPR